MVCPTEDRVERRAAGNSPDGRLDRGSNLALDAFMQRGGRRGVINPARVKADAPMFAPIGIVDGGDIARIAHDWDHLMAPFSRNGDENGLRCAGAKKRQQQDQSLHTLISWMTRVE